MLANFRFPTMIRFGRGAVKTLPHELVATGCKRPLLVTDAGLAGSEKVNELLDSLHAQGLQVEIFADACGNPKISHARAGNHAYNQHSADSVVMFGGGCALDVGKAVALMAKHPGDLLEYEDGKDTGRSVDPDLVPPMIAVPSTAGTGSEVGGSAVLSCDETNAKLIIWGHALVPQCVLADPELTVTLPPHLTAATGIDALTHSVEAYLAKNFHPMCDAIALRGIAMILGKLPTAYHQPNDIEAREAMLMAAMMGAVAFQKGLGVTHSCAHALSTCYDLHHGLANALMLLPCLRFNGEKFPNKLADIGRSIGLTGSDRKVADTFCSRIEELIAELGLPRTLRELNVKCSKELVDIALADPCHANNPRVCTRDDFMRLFMLGGAL